MSNVFKVISNEGSVGKTLIALSIASYYQKAGKPLAKFVCDHSLQDLATAYGMYKKGELLSDEQQEPIAGVKYFDTRTDAKELINNLTKYKDIDILEDHKADSLDEQNSFSSGIAPFIKAYTYTKNTLWYVVPVGTADKSLQSIKVLAETFRGINTGNTVKFLFVLNHGMMEVNDTTKKVMKAYADSDAVAELKATGNAFEMSMRTVLDEAQVKLLKTKSFNQILELGEKGEIDLFERLALDEHFEQFHSDFSQIVGL